MVYVCQQLYRLPLRQDVQILCTSPLLVQMYHCTEEFWICWKILSGTDLLWQHLVAYSSQTWVYWRVSFWWFLGCREAKCWQSSGQSLVPRYCMLCSSLASLTHLLFIRMWSNWCFDPVGCIHVHWRHFGWGNFIWAGRSLCSSHMLTSLSPLLFVVY